MSASRSRWRRQGLIVTTAVRALRRNAMRSLLTALGIIIGVAAVVGMVAIGNGARASIEESVSALGQNVLTVFSSNRGNNGVRAGTGSMASLTLADYRALSAEVPGVAALSPEVSTNAQVVANGRNWSTSVVGVATGYTQIRDWQLSAGTMFDEHDVNASSKVALLGPKVAHELFGPLNPIGQSVRIRNTPFLVVGLLESKGSGFGGGDQDDRILIPYTTAMRRLTGERNFRSVTIRVTSAEAMDSTQSQIATLLRQRHRAVSGENDDFSIMNQKEIADTMSTVTGAITLLLASIAGMSLVVGGIGIMNIMLVSIKERTREIGLRIALGARPGDIRLQFLLEAVALSLAGGVIGLAIGVGISSAVGALSPIKPVVTASSVALAFGVSFLVGVFFGSYPATRAAKLDPIDALRYE